MFVEPVKAVFLPGVVFVPNIDSSKLISAKPSIIKYMPDTRITTTL